MDFFSEYRLTVIFLGLVGLIQFIQLVVVDVVAIKKKHTPGYPISADHNNVLFRANRAFMNTNESISIYLLFVLFAMFSQASASWLAILSASYFISRVLHMMCYYFDLKLVRSISFGTSLVALLGIFAIGINQWI